MTQISRMRIRVIREKSVSIRERGVALIELILVLAILVILASVGFGFYFSTRTLVELEEEELRIVEVLRQAKAQAMAGEQGYQWGVRFDNVDTALPFFALFSGANYAGSATTTKYFLSSAVEYTTPSGGSATETVFTKRTGTTTATTISMRSKANTASTKTVSVSAVGLISK